MILPGRRLVQPRCQILVEYAKWTARAAANSGGPIKDTDTIYRLLDEVVFGEVLSGAEVSSAEFDGWHQRQTEALCCRANKHLHDVALENEKQPAAKFPVGWSAKLINVFLKTAVYAGGLGHERLRDVLHPPLDNGLKKGLKKHFRACCPDRPDILGEVDFGSISAITDYDKYRGVIAGCRLAACCLGCSLIEVEQLAGLGLRKDEAPPGELVSAICHYVR